MGVIILRFNKIIVATLLLLAILTIGAASASENVYSDDSTDVAVLGDDDLDEDFDDDDFDDDDFDDDDFDDDDFEDEDGPEDKYVFSDVENDIIYYSDGNKVITYLADLPQTATGTFSIYEGDNLLATKTVQNGKESFMLSELNFGSGSLGDHELYAIYDDGINTYEKLVYLNIVDYKIVGPAEIYLGDDAVFTITMPSTVNGRVEAYRDEEYIGSGQVVNGVGTVRLSKMPLGSYEIEFILNSAGLDDFYFLTVSPKKITVTPTAYLGVDNFFTVSLPSDASGILSVEVKNLKTGELDLLEAKYTKGKVVMPADKLAGGSYAITDFYIEDKKYGDYSFVDLPNYVDGANYATFKVAYPKLTLNKIKTLSKRKSAAILKLTVGNVNGKYAVNQKVIFKFQTKTYTAKTNSKGVALVKVPNAVFKNLSVGKKVTYKATYFKKTLKYTLKMVK